MEPNGSVVHPSEKPESNPQMTSPALEPAELHGKRARILDACEQRDVTRLRALATSEGGLISDDIRRQAWPLLLGCTEGGSRKERDSACDSWRALPKHHDEDQVQLDVDRSFIYYPNDQSSYQLNHRKQELSDLIIKILRLHPYLCYFQGYHDICQVFLLVLDQSSRADSVVRLSMLHIRDFMLPTLAPALAQLQLIPAIIYSVNPSLCNHLSQTQPFFALSGTLTMYAHDIQEYGDISRLFDVLLARETVFSVYLFAQIVLQRSDELFETPANEPEMLHSILSKLPRPLDIEKLIKETVKLLEDHPPEKLQVWRSISKSSVLKTARWPDQTIKQSLEDGEAYFNEQMKEIKWAEQREKILKKIWMYRRPASTIGLAVLVGVLSFWLRRSAGPSGYFGSFWRQWVGYMGH